MAETAKTVTTQVQQFTSEWNKIVAEQVARVETGLTEFAKLESKALAQAATGVEEAGRIAKETMALAEKASAEWRKLFLDATRRAASIVTPGQA